MQAPENAPGASRNPLSVALAGCGRAAKHHIRAICRLEKEGALKLLAVADPDRQKAAAFLQKEVHGHYRSLPIFDNVSSMLDNAVPQILAIVTPSGTHKNYALEGLKRGAHILLEKPLAMTLTDTREIAAAVQASGQKLALGHIYRYFPGVAELHEALAEGRFGRILYGSVALRWGHDQAYYDASPWRGTRAADGGVIMNQSVHALDLMRWLLLAEDSAIVKVTGLCDRQTHEMECEDLALGVFAFSNGSYLHYEGSTSTQPKRHQAEFFLACTGADIRASLDGKRLHFSVTTRQGERGRQIWWPALRRMVRDNGLPALTALANPHQAIYRDLLAAIDQDRQPLADVRAGVSSLEMVEALYQACGILPQSDR